MELQFYIAVIAALFVAILLSTTAYAADINYSLPGYISQSIISGDSGSNVKGNVAVNQAAGDANLQANSAAIAINPNGPATAYLGLGQSTATGQATVPNISIARVGDRAFANTRGLLSINQVSGTGNAQANGIAFAYGLEGEVISESALAQSVSNVGNSALSPLRLGTEVRILDIEATAFDNSHGVVQLNQSAGTGNATRNNFAFSISLDAK